MNVFHGIAVSVTILLPRSAQFTVVTSSESAGTPQLHRLREPGTRPQPLTRERHAVQRALWEFPAGQIDEPDGHEKRETIVATTLRELKEECGCELSPVSGRLEPLGYFFPSQGFTTEHVYLFRASPVCVVSRPEPDGSEHISDVRFVSAEELRRMIAENEITNALTLALYARMSAKGWV
jgi:8-oxo-dGTP pyrophosphatase MutT (NUDIX family)